MPVIIGKITVMVEAYDENGISKVEFYIDNEFKTIDDSPPYEWLWDEFAIGKHEIRAIAYNNEGNKAEDKINIIIFNLGGRK